MKALTAILGALFISLTAQAGEGFADEINLQILKSAWSQTYAMSDTNSAAPVVSASVLVFKKAFGNDVYLGFLTSGHSLEGMKRRVDGLLKHIIVSRDLYFVGQTLRTGEINGQIVSAAVDMDRELGFFVVQVPGGDLNDFSILPFSPTCETPRLSRLTLVGFPGIYLREILNQNQKAAPIAVRKRASFGLYVGEMRFGEDQSSRLFPIFGTTADALDGNSGGPAVNGLGQLLGILVGSKASKDNGYAYQGGEEWARLTAHSFITGCQMTKRFAFDQWGRFFQDLKKK